MQNLASFQQNRNRSGAGSVGKPPKMRYKVGTYVKNKVGALFFIKIAYRKRDNPNEWIYVLEEREKVGDPSTDMSKLLQQSPQAKFSPNDAIVIWELQRDGMQLPGTETFYWFGCSVHTPNKLMIHEYEVVDAP